MHPRKPAQMTIIIVNWNSKDFLRNCLASIVRHCEPDLVEVVVVDGASFDGCADMIANEFPSVLFVQSDDNVGFARANNLGARHASTDLLLFLNPDTELVLDAPGVLRRRMDSLLNAGIVGCTLLNSDRTVQTSCVQPYPTVLNQVLDAECLRRWFPKWRLWGVQPMTMHRGEAVEVEAVIGACICMKREVFEKVGGFTESYFMYGEDLDLCFKVRHAGYRVYHISDAEVVHHGSGSTPIQLSNFSNVMMRESVYRFLHLRSGIASATAYRAAMGVSAVLRIILTFGLMILSLFSRDSAHHLTASLRKWSAILRWSLCLSAGQRPT